MNMKKQKLVLSMYFLSMIGMIILLMSCSKDKSVEVEPEIQGIVIQQITVDPITASTFDKFCEQCTFHSSAFIEGKNITSSQGYCIINSKEDLEALNKGVEVNNKLWEATVNYVQYMGKSDIPEVDFTKYSLVLGKLAFFPDLGAKCPSELKKQTLYHTNGGYVMELKYTSYIVECATYLEEYVYFWGIYPKLEPLPIYPQIKYIE